MADVKQKVQELLEGDSGHVVLWSVAFVGVCVLVALGKIKPETVEYLLFAMGGAAASKKAQKPTDQAEDK